jgi:hypothetical protein
MATADAFKKLSHREHVLELPDTYVGSTDTHEESRWVFDSTSGKMVRRLIAFNPGFYKIFDEIIVNAADNKVKNSILESLKKEILDIEFNSYSHNEPKLVIYLQELYEQFGDEIFNSKNKNNKLYLLFKNIHHKAKQYFKITVNTTWDYCDCNGCRKFQSIENEHRKFGKMKNVEINYQFDKVKFDNFKKIVSDKQMSVFNRSKIHNMDILDRIKSY